MANCHLVSRSSFFFLKKEGEIQIKRKCNFVKPVVRTSVKSYFVFSVLVILWYCCPGKILKGYTENIIIQYYDKPLLRRSIKYEKFLFTTNGLII